MPLVMATYVLIMRQTFVRLSILYIYVMFVCCLVNFTMLSIFGIIPMLKYHVSNLE